jgi:hypothetical protein
MNVSIFRKQLWALVVAMLLLNITRAQSVLNGLSPDTKVSQLSDQQMLQLWQEAQKNGLSENQAVKLMAQKGMGASEINTFKRRLLDLQNNSRTNRSGH